jgi:hypothetical protein
MMAAAAAVSGHFTDVRKWQFNPVPIPSHEVESLS